MINKNDLKKAISSIAISNPKRNTIYKAFSDLDSITKEEFDSVKSYISNKADKNETIVEIKRLTGKIGREWNSYTDTEEYSDFKQYLISKGNYCGFYVNILSRPFTAEGFYSNYKPLISFGNGIKLAAYRIHTLHIGIFRDEATTHVPLYEFEIQDNKQNIIIIAPIELIDSYYNEYDGIGIYAYAADEYNIVRPTLVNVGKQISLDLFKSVLAKDPNYKNEIGFISYTNSNNYRVKYADGRYALINTDKNVVIGGKDYNANDNIHAEGFGENGTTFTRGGTLEVNGSATVRDLTTRSITANGSVTINNKLNVEKSISTNSTLKAGETTINGTLHCETHDIKTKSVYPAGTGSSSLKDPSLGAVKGNYIVNKGNLGKPAHNYDKLFVENIFWSDRTDFLNPETSLNTDYWHSVYRIFSKKGYKGKPTFYTNYTMYNELDDGYQIGIFSDMEEGIGSDPNITMFYNNFEENPEGMFSFHLDHGYIKHTIYGESKDCVFGNGVRYDAKTKIPADFVNLSEYVKSNEIYQCIKKDYDSSKRGTNSIAIDDSAIASGNYATAIGNGAQVTASYSIALGSGAGATKDNATALGHDAKATGMYSIALGYNTKATKDYSIVVGTNILETGINSMALGSNVKATGECSIALGNYAQATADSSLALGDSAQATGIASIALCGGQAIGTASIALGSGAVTSTVSKYALGGMDDNKKVIFNLEEITYSQYGNKKYLIGLGGYDGTNITINNEAGEKVLNPNIKSVQDIINSKADLVDGKLKAEQLPKLVNITTASTAEEVVTKFNALLADLKAKGYM